MAEEKKLFIYRWDQDNNFSTKDIVDEGYELKDNETFDPVPQPERQPLHRVGGQNGHWQQPTDEEHEAYIKAFNEQLAKDHPELVNQSAGPSAQAKFNASTSVQMAQLLQANQEQKKINANLTVQIAQLLKDNKAND